MESVFELVRCSHQGDRDLEVSDDMLAEVARASAEAGTDRRSRALAHLSGGYGRMTPEYDRVCVAINDFLLEHGGRNSGAIQRLGAGWGGQVGGLIHEDFVTGEDGARLQEFMEQELGLKAVLRQSVVSPGAGACLLSPPETKA